MNRRCITAIAVWRPWGATLLAAFAAIAVFALPGITSWMQYNRTLVGHGELWRLVTSHWTHWTGEHLLWDVGAFCVLLFLALRISRRRTLTILAAASILIPLIVMICLPDMEHYRGLSGLDSALYVFVACIFLKRAHREKDKVGYVLLLGLVLGFGAKIAFEIVTGQTLFVQSMGAGITGVPLAHLIGACIGLTGSIDKRCNSRSMSGTPELRNFVDNVNSNR